MSIALDALSWVGIPLAFLAVYILKFNEPADAIVPHMSIVTNAAVSFVCVRILIWRFSPHATVAAWASTILVAAPIVVLCTYYLLVLVGLSSWGRVISWKLISSYAGQAGYLVEALGFTPWLVWVGLTLVVLAVVFFIKFLQRDSDWTAVAAHKLSGVLAVFISLVIFSIVTVRLYGYIAVSPVHAREPVSLTIFPDQASSRLQSHSTAAGRELDAKEESARATYVPGAEAKRHNVIIIVGDALRADHMSAYGYQRPTTPNIDGWLAEGNSDRAQSMYAACAESSCGLMALANSKYVHQISSRPFSLQEVLRLHGYRIHLILGGDHTNFYGLREAYGPVDSYFDGASAKGYYMNDDRFILNHVAAFPEWDGQPVFIQFHLMSSHPLGTRYSHSLKYLPAANYGAWARSGDSERSLDGGTTNAVINYYDNGVEQFDSVVEQLLGLLRLKGYLDTSIVVITGDHGEMLGEHGQYSHANGVHEGVLRIPFLMLRFGFQRTYSFEPESYASQVDIAPTVLNELQMPMPASWSGSALQRRISPRFILFQQGSDVGLLDPRAQGQVFKYWRNTRTTEEYVYLIPGDSLERQNVVRNVPIELLKEWRLQVLPGANAIAE